MKNSEKMIKILSSCHHVKCWYFDHSYTLIFEYDGEYFFTDSEPMSKEEFDGCNLKIEPIYVKPNFKSGDWIDICDEYDLDDSFIKDEEKKNMLVESVDEFGCSIDFGDCIIHIPFWALSNHIEDSKVKKENKEEEVFTVKKIKDENGKEKCLIEFTTDNFETVMGAINAQIEDNNK